MMEHKSDEISANPVEDCLIDMIDGFAKSFRQLRKPDTHIHLWLDTLNSVVSKILDVYKICFLTKNNSVSCQSVVDSLDSLRKAISSVSCKNDNNDEEISLGDEDHLDCNGTETNDSMKSMISSVSHKENEDISIADENYDYHSRDCEVKGSADSQCAFTFGDVNYDLIMNQAKDDTACNQFPSSFTEEDLYYYKELCDVAIQTDVTMAKCCCQERHKSNSVAVQVSNIKIPHYSSIHCSSDYNLNDPYLCNQNYEELYHNVHYCNESYSYHNGVLDRNYSESPNNFSHQYQPFAMPTPAPLPLPGRNISAPVFFPRFMAPHVPHSGGHPVPYSVTTYTSSQSYIPGTFNPTAGSPHFVGVPGRSQRESRKSQWKIDAPVAKKQRSSCRRKNACRISSIHDKALKSAKVEVRSLESCEATPGYITMIDELERAYNSDLSEQKKVGNDEMTSLACSKSVDMVAERLNEKSKELCHIISDFQEVDKKRPVESEKASFSIPESIRNPSPNPNCEKYFDVQCSTSIPFESPSKSAVALIEPIDVNEESLDVSKSADSKKSFVNALTAGLKVDVDSKTCSVEKASPDLEVEPTKPPPNIFELSQFPTLSSSEPSDQSNYFQNAKETLTKGTDASIPPNKSAKENYKLSNGCNSSSYSPGSKTDELPRKSKVHIPLSKTTQCKSLPVKRNLQTYCQKKSDKINRNGCRTAKNSCGPSQPKSMKVDLSCNPSHLLNGNSENLNASDKKNRSEEIIQSKKHSINKRKSVPGEDGWTVVPFKYRNPDPWGTKEIIKKMDDLSISNDSRMSNKSAINNSGIQPERANQTQSVFKENCFSLLKQEPYFLPVPLDCSSSFYDESSSVMDSYDICQDLNVSETSGFALSSINLIDHAPDGSNLQNSSVDHSTDQYPSDFCVSPTSHVSLNTSNEFSDQSVCEMPQSKFPKIKPFLDHSNTKTEISCVQTKLEILSAEVRKPALPKKNVLGLDINTLDDLKVSKWPICDESIANFVSYPSWWSEVFKPDSDSDDQHLNEEDFRKSKELQEEAQMLQEKIKNLESNENELDTENEGEYENENPEDIDPNEIYTEYSNYLSQISWGDQIDEMERFQEMFSSDPDDSIFKFQYGSLEQFQELVERHPGKALDLHYKLLGRGKRSNSDELNEIRRKKAEEKRQRLLNRKAAKMRELLQRVEEVKQAQLQISEERKCRINLKLKKAEENRNLHLKTIQKKAHDEEEKLKEIAFINELEAQNRRHDSLALRQEQEGRLQNIMEERQRKVDEKAAKDAAVGERKRVLEAERQEKIEKIQQKRREKEENIGKKQQEREMERLVTAREKAREREERLLAIQAAQIANAEELQKKIKQKQESMAKRHEEIIQHIRQKAFETGMMRITLQDDSNSDCSSKNIMAADKKKCAPHAILDGEVPPRANKHQKKKCKKIRSRLQKMGCQFIAATHEAYCSKSKTEGRVLNNVKACVSTLKKLYENNEIKSDFGLNKLQKQLKKLMDTAILTQMPESKTVFKYTYGFEEVLRILVHLISPEIRKLSSSVKCIQTAVEILMQVCDNDATNVEYFLSCSQTCDFLDALAVLFAELLDSIMETPESVFDLCSILLAFQDLILRSCIPSAEEIHSANCNVSKELLIMLKDFVGYYMYSGLLKKFSDIIKLASMDPVEFKVNETMIEAIITFVTHLVQPHFFWKDFEDLLVSTDFMSTICLLYGHLHVAQQNFPSFTYVIIKFFKTIASTHLTLFQRVIGADGFALQFRYIAGFILQNFNTYKSRRIHELVNNTILVIGYFAAKNPVNQSILQSGQAPTVLQQLTALPIQYFCDTELKPVLFPTLIAICDGNAVSRELLENEMSYNHIETFLADPTSKFADVMVALNKMEQNSSEPS